MASDIELKISADVQQAVNGIQSVVQRLDSLQKKTEENRKSFSSMAATFAVVSTAINTVSGYAGKLVIAIQACTTAYSAQELAERKLQTTLRATQSAVGMTAGELLDLADSLSRVTTYSDQEILAVEQMLAATRQISAEVMPEATQAILDMAAATGEDATNAAQRLAQALSDPAGEIESLKEAGIQLTEEQKKNIQKVQEQNGVYEAQKLILREVAGTYGGMAKSIADTDTGKLQQIANVWTDIKEGLGEALLDKLGPALDWLYERLLDIEEWINDINLPGQIENAVKMANGVTPDFSAYSDTQLIRSINPRMLSTGAYAYTGEQDVIDAVINELIERGVKFPGADNGLSDNMQIIRAWALEMSERNPVGQFLAMNADSPIPQSDLIRNNLGFKFSENDLMYWNYYQDLLADIEASRTAGLKAPSDISPARAALEGKLGGWEEVGTVGSASPNNGASHFVLPESSSIDDFINSNNSLSASAQIDAINEKIRESSRLMLEVSPDSDAYTKLNEINDALWEQKEALLGLNKEAVDIAGTLTDAFVSLGETVISSVFDGIINSFQTMADEAEKELDDIREKWDEYFEDLDERQERQSESLSAMLTSGNISYEDYIDAMNHMDEARAEAQEEAAKEEEEAKKKADELNKAAFDAEKANNIADAVMSGAMSIANIWATHGGNPVLAGILTGVSAAAVAAQIGVISSQKYTSALAAGGIVTAPTTALIGEGGSPEAVLPLNEGNMERFGLGSDSGGGVINITINVGASYTGEDLAENIFRGIERAQRTGALPRWRYA